MSELTWTSEKPTAPGWYWWRSPTDRVMICDVYEWDYMFFVTTIGEPLRVGGMAGQWAGPIPEPVEAK